MTNNCKVDFMNKEIRITKKFYKNSQFFGSEEFEIMCQLENRLPHFELKFQHSNRTTNRQNYPTYAQMMDFISTKDNSPESRKEFTNVIQAARVSGKGYNLGRRWFFEKYLQEFDEFMAA